MEQFAAFIPPDLSPVFALVLVLVSFITSGIAAAIGLGGGIALLAVMAMAMPMAVLIPVHGVVQLGSNAGRALVQARHVDWSVLLWVTLGGLLGAWTGGQIVVSLPDAPLKLALGAFVLWSVWGRKPTFDKLPRSLLALAGFVAAMLTMFFGATGPFIAGVVHPVTKIRHTFVATHAACMTFQHLLKVIVFGLLGFAFGPWLPLMIAMLVTGFFGTLAGSMLLGRMPEETFRTGFRIVMTLLAINLMLQAAGVDFV